MLVNSLGRRGGTRIVSDRGVRAIVWYDSDVCGQRRWVKGASDRGCLGIDRYDSDVCSQSSGMALEMKQRQRVLRSTS